MGWVGSPRALVVASPDPVLAVLSSIGLACSAGSGLVVDFGDACTGRARTLADLAYDGPTRAELSPGRSGVAVLSAGSISEEDSAETLNLLAASWPAVVVRNADPRRLPFPSVPVHPLIPDMAPHLSTAVWQPTNLRSVPPGTGPVLPRLSRGLVMRVLRGGHPGRGRWIRAWRQVWELPWA